MPTQVLSFLALSIGTFWDALAGISTVFCSDKFDHNADLNLHTDFLCWKASPDDFEAHIQMYRLLDTAVQCPNHLLGGHPFA